MAAGGRRRRHEPSAGLRRRVAGSCRAGGGGGRARPLAQGVGGGVAQEDRRVAAHLMAQEVRAAGGVVWRVPEGGGVEVLLVHRPGYDDWTFPKGKVDPDDIDEEHTALREVAEESGLRCTLGRELPGTDYVDRRGRPQDAGRWGGARGGAGAP